MERTLKILFSFFALMILATGLNAYAVEPFGLTLGETTLSEFKNAYAAEHGGSNTWTKGPVYDMKTQDLGANGLTKAVAIFDTSERLVALILTFESSKFEEINRLAESRLKLVKAQLPQVGNKKASYKDGAVSIEINSPHMSFDMTLSYEHSDFLLAYNEVMTRIRTGRKDNAGNLLFGGK